MSYNFEAIIKKISDKDATFIEIPFDVEKEFGARRVKVKTKFDGIDYRGSIVNMGQDCFIIGITKAVRKQIGKDVGDTVFIEVEKDEEIREVEIPEDFKSELDKNKEALNFYNSLSYSAKRKYYQWITGAKKETTRQKRITESVSKLESKIKL
ncbi:YdeI/OmpD-associated family protein [Paraclostridium bifermentans]|uniref:YdeI/OmpD-associated family protein n=1 Tax=Paraclostridium bifermentans TaxID=1490 RepID=UPI0018998171|nr:YdeI/OmpD-associated family protein [Paraclostridium bifermentans]